MLWWIEVYLVNFIMITQIITADAAKNCYTEEDCKGTNTTCVEGANGECTCESANGMQTNCSVAPTTTIIKSYETPKNCYTTEDCKETNTICVEGANGECSCESAKGIQAICSVRPTTAVINPYENNKYGVSTIAFTMCLFMIPIIAYIQCCVGWCLLMHLSALHLGYKDEVRLASGCDTHHLPL